MADPGLLTLTFADLVVDYVLLVELKTVKALDAAHRMQCANYLKATGLRLTDKNSLVDDMKAALVIEGPVMVDVRVTPEENVYPMIPAGQAARDMVG